VGDRSGQHGVDDWCLRADAVLEELRCVGSKAAMGYANPEGIVVYHKPSGSCFKATLENDAEWKGGNRDRDGNIVG